MTAKCQTKSHVTKVCWSQVVLYPINKKSALTLFFHGLVDANRAVMETAILPSAEEKVVSGNLYHCLVIFLQTALFCCEMQFTRCSHKHYYGHCSILSPD
jgi:hypothetical protein